jgi:Recombination endonuclease VII
MFTEQNGRCFICLKSPMETRPRRNLAVDHDHQTGRIRGLLCFNCNHNLLGRLLKDDLEKAKRIVKYLSRTTNYGLAPSGG